MIIARSVHPLPGEAERKEQLLDLIYGFSGRRLLIVGDLIADEFIYGEVARVSREAPATQPTTSPRSVAARASLVSSAPIPKARACSRAFMAASIAARSSAR